MTIIEKIKKYGIRGVWNFFCQRLIKTYLIKAHYLRLNIDPAQLDTLMNGFDLDVKELTYEDFLLGNPNEFQGSKMDVYRNRFQDDNYKAYGIIENGRLVYSTWISFHRVGMSIETKPIYLAPNEGYLEDSYCDPTARGRGFHGKMNNFRIQKIFESGRNRVIAIVQDGNTPAFKVQFKSGLEEIGTFYHGHIFGIKVNTLKKEKFDGK
jgi:hypothetical protein